MAALGAQPKNMWSPVSMAEHRSQALEGEQLLE
jgi:hypothetical protein